MHLASWSPRAKNFGTSASVRVKESSFISEKCRKTILIQISEPARDDIVSQEEMTCDRGLITCKYMRALGAKKTTALIVATGDIDKCSKEFDKIKDMVDAVEWRTDQLGSTGNTK